MSLARPRRRPCLMVERSIVVKNETGLHARPAALFVEAAGKFESAVRLLKEGREVDGKSLIGLLSLGVNRGAVVTIRATGEDAAEAVATLATLVESGLGEK